MLSYAKGNNHACSFACQNKTGIYRLPEHPVPVCPSSHKPLLRAGPFCRKENIQKPSKWSDQKLPQKNTLVQPAIPVLDIPVDEDIQNQPSPGQAHPVPKVNSCKSPLCMALCSLLALQTHLCSCSMFTPSLLQHTCHPSAVVHLCLACCTQGTLRQRLDRTAGSAVEERLLKNPLQFHKKWH